MENTSLSQQGQANLNELMDYHRGRLLEFERTRSLQRKGMGGKHNVIRLIEAQRANNVRTAAPYELEISDQIAKEVGRQPEPGYHYVPVSRDLTAASGSGGGFLVSAEMAPGDLFVGAALPILRNMLPGIQIVPMQGNAVIPRVSGSITVYWLGTEAAQLTESQFAFVQASGTPKNVGGYVEISDLWLKQAGPGAQAFVMTELARAVVSDVHAKIINGSGAAGQPTGILQTAGVGSVAGAALTWSSALDAVLAVENANTIAKSESLAWAMAPGVAKLLRLRERAAGSGFIVDDNRMAGYPVDSTNSVPAGTAVFADWSSLALLAWSTLQVGSDPYGANSALFQKGLVGVRALWTIDVVVLQPAGFCKVTAIT